MSGHLPPYARGAVTAAPALLDARARPLRDLRVSVTDRCNFRCRYCMPRETVAKGSFLQRAEILRFEEIVRIAQVFVQLGVTKLRLTGGEPLLRKDLPVLVEQLARLGVDLALTTNGVLLREHARALRQAGLKRITVSLDALDEAVFQKVADAPGFSAADVLAGIACATDAGFGPIKINCVLRRGENESEVKPLLRHFAGSGHVLRFIEFMDVGTRNDWVPSEVFSRAALLEQMSALGTVTPLPPSDEHEVAQRFHLQLGAADSGNQADLEVGIIASVTQPFCQTCSRARLSADGRIFTCLFAAHGHDVRSLLRAGHSNRQLAQRIQAIWSARGDRYSEQRIDAHQAQHGLRLPLVRAEMSYIGG